MKPLPLLAVNRHINRFPQDLMFHRTKEELKNLRSQFATSSWGEARYLPFISGIRLMN
ncbi:MAG: ORF6N domain-containing protein [Desulfobacterales bacterium]